MPLSRKNEASIQISNIDEKVTYQILWELLIQTGPIANLKYKIDRVTNKGSGFATVEYCKIEDAEYTYKIMNGIQLFQKPLRMIYNFNPKIDILPQIYIGNLSEKANEKAIREIFSEFGTIKDLEICIEMKIGKITYSNFEEADLAIKEMNSQYLFGGKIKVDYAYKNQYGTKHGTKFERYILENLNFIN